MLDINEYRKISLEFRRYASNLLKIKCTDGNIPLVRFKNYIDNNDIIINIILEKIDGVEYDITNFVNNGNDGWGKVNIPVDEACHVKAMYDYMSYLVDNKISIERIALNFLCGSKKIDDHLQYFVDLVFKPLIEFVTDQLALVVIMKEPPMGININNNSGNINLADRGSVIENKVSIVENDIDKVLELINSIKCQVGDLNINEESKEFFIDDLEIIDEHLNSISHKPARLKKAFNNIKEFLSNSVFVTGMCISLANNISQLVAYLEPIIDKL